MSNANIQSDILISTNGSYNLVAVVAILTFDIVETLRNENTYIWKKKFGTTNLLYITTRYLPFLINATLLIITLILNFGIPTDVRANISPLVLTLFYCIPWFGVLACTEYLFIVRAAALNGNSRWLYYTLVVLFIAEVITGLVFYLISLLITKSLTETNPTIVTFDSQLTVVIFPKLNSVIAFGIPELVFQSILVLVIIFTVIRHQKTWTSGGHGTSLTTIIIRDGIWGYLFNLFGLLVVIVQPDWLAGPAGQPSVQWSYVTFSITSSRLLLNIRSGAGTAGNTPGVSTDMTSYLPMTIIRRAFKQNRS